MKRGSHLAVLAATGAMAAALSLLAPHESSAAPQPQPTPQPSWNPEQRLPEAESGQGFSSEAQQNGVVDVPAFLTVIVKDADRMWAEYFARIQGLVEPSVRYHLVGTVLEPTYTFAAECGGTVVTGFTSNAYYCHAGEGDIVLPVFSFAKIWSGELFGRVPEKTGDFAAAVVVAHEFGHHIQDEIFKQYNALNVPVPDMPSGDKNKELIADCFSGNWAFSAFHKGYIQSGDWAEVIASLRAIGDPPGKSGHGTPDERQAAFERGYNTGDPTRCIVAYWPGAASALNLR
ncbi:MULTISPECIES: neutral zinc metallopeptidase [unclassified Streptomyces]|uniref:neutral zinc metallopeptidase n=1 Tax=unclassified Streptomyces TaxID=2593676 RepID=UPI000DC7C488|nr:MULTISPECIES: neutral zinc metallopeptidase [unclassified Streptomyces]AWZ06826.1 hypothetical protein DRB89_21855 [Streptomyces sp. ICC4]